MTCLIQYFDADFPWKVSLKILNSGMTMKTLTYVRINVALINSNSKNPQVVSSLRTKC